jgi:Family of unknown function (DUF6789)
MSGGIISVPRVAHRPALPLPAFHLPLRAGQPGALASAARAGLFVLIGSSPILSIPPHVLGLIDIHDSARLVVLPSVAVFAVMVSFPSAESAWAIRGVLAGLGAVSAYDALRIPLAIAGILPDFIPELGGWILGSDRDNAVAGYLWRYLGDGAGIGLVFFVVAAVVQIHLRPPMRRHLVTAGVLYGVFVWCGLIATVRLSSGGPAQLFDLTAAAVVLGLAGHLVYGAVLGACYASSAWQGTALWVRSHRARAQWATPSVTILSILAALAMLAGVVAGLG